MRNDAEPNPAPRRELADIRDAHNDDWQRIGHILGVAFAEDPVSRWTLGSPVMIEDMLTRLARHVYLPHGHCQLSEAGAGTLWLPPGASKQMPWKPTFSAGISLLRHVHPRHLWRALQVDAEMIKRRPKTPHKYLFAVGVLPEARGKGLGVKILNAMLDQCDRLTQPAFLENSNPKNHSLYRGLGFEVIETYHPAPGCPPITSMWRYPRRSQT